MPRPVTALLAAAALICAGLSPAPAAAAPARQADSFVDSIGVNVRLGHTDTSYRRYGLVQQKLERLGVRHIRDGLNPGQPQVYEAWRSLARRGITLNLIVGDPLQRWGVGPLSTQLSLIKSAGITDALASLEGPNEYDNQGDRTWVPTLRGYQERLYRSVKGDPELRRFPVLGPSLVHRDSRAQLGDVSRSLDFGNIHPYPGGRQPDRSAHMSDELALAAGNSRSKPMQATETGYHNAVNSSDSHRPATERATGVYMPRLFLDYFRRGIARTYSYELLDHRSDGKRRDLEANFGLLRSDFSEKPAYTAIRRLTALLSDPGPAFRPSRLGYSVKSGARGLRQVLLQKRDGTFYLALWGRRTGRVRVSFDRRIRNVAIHRPSESARAAPGAVSARSLALTVSRGVSIVEIGPSAAKSAR